MCLCCYSYCLQQCSQVTRFKTLKMVCSLYSLSLVDYDGIVGVVYCTGAHTHLPYIPENSLCIHCCSWSQTTCCFKKLRNVNYITPTFLLCSATSVFILCTSISLFYVFTCKFKQNEVSGKKSQLHTSFPSLTDWDNLQKLNAIPGSHSCEGYKTITF